MAGAVILFFLLATQINSAAAGEDITSHLQCPCECAMIISTCDCSTAVQIKKEISQMKENGFSEKQVVAALQAEYGEGILSTHTKKVDSSTLWIAGSILTFLIIVLGYVITRKPNPDIIPVPGKEQYEQRFEEEYRKFVSELEEK